MYKQKQKQKQKLQKRAVYLNHHEDLSRKLDNSYVICNSKPFVGYLFKLLPSTKEMILYGILDKYAPIADQIKLSKILHNKITNKDLLNIKYADDDNFVGYEFILNGLCGSLDGYKLIIKTLGNFFNELPESATKMKELVKQVKGFENKHLSCLEGLRVVYENDIGTIYSQNPLPSNIQENKDNPNKEYTILHTSGQVSSTERQTSSDQIHTQQNTQKSVLATLETSQIEKGKIEQKTIDATDMREWGCQFVFDSVGRRIAVRPNLLFTYQLNNLILERYSAYVLASRKMSIEPIFYMSNILSLLKEAIRYSEEVRLKISDEMGNILSVNEKAEMHNPTFYSYCSSFGLRKPNWIAIEEFSKDMQKDLLCNYIATEGENTGKVCAVQCSQMYIERKKCEKHKDL